MERPAACRAFHVSGPEAVAERLLSGDLWRFVVIVGALSARPVLELLHQTHEPSTTASKMMPPFSAVAAVASP